MYLLYSSLCVVVHFGCIGRCCTGAQGCDTAGVGDAGAKWHTQGTPGCNPGPAVYININKVIESSLIFCKKWQLQQQIIGTQNCQSCWKSRNVKETFVSFPTYTTYSRHHCNASLPLDSGSFRLGWKSHLWTYGCLLALVVGVRKKYLISFLSSYFLWCSVWSFVFLSDLHIYFYLSISVN